MKPSPSSSEATRYSTPKPPAQNGSCVTAYSSTVYRTIWRRVSSSPRTTGSIGTPTLRYSSFISSDSAQKWGGVQKKTMKNRITAVPLTDPVTAVGWPPRQDAASKSGDVSLATCMVVIVVSSISDWALGLVSST